MAQLRTAVIGVGYLGRYHAQKYAQNPACQLVAVCDSRFEQAAEIAAACHTEAITDYRTLLNKVDAVSIAVPTPLHYKIAKDFLAAGIHVLVEKPITTTLEEAEELIQLAKANNVLLQVGHVERFNNVIKAAESRIHNPRFIESIRLAPFQLRGTDVNVVLDLMIHDLDLVQYIVNAPIAHIAANGTSILSPFMDIVNARVEFTNGCVANITASRVSVKRERKLRLFQTNGYISLDLDNKTFAAYRKGQGEMFPGIPQIESELETCDPGDPLNDQIIAFIDSILQGKPAVVSGEDGKRALQTAIEITQIIQDNRVHQEAAEHAKPTR